MPVIDDYDAPLTSEEQVDKYRAMPLCKDLTERASVGWSYWLDCSPHERTEADGLIVAHYARLAHERVHNLETALHEAERFMAYFAGETGGVFVGEGTPASCLAAIREALAVSSSTSI